MARHDYLPFGEEIPGNTAWRDSTFGASDNVNQKFTGQERDAETGLDFFQARYYTGGVMRFMSPDPGNAGADLYHPQSWNGYSYVMNNPLNSVDPSGMGLFSVIGDFFSGVGSFFSDLFGGGGGSNYCLSFSGGSNCGGGGSSDSTGDSGGAGGSGGGFSFTPVQDGSGGGGSGGAGGSAPVQQPPKTGNPPLAACESSILNAVNNKFKTQFTSANVTTRFQFSTGAPTGQGTLNLNVTVPLSSQPTTVSVGRFPVNPATYFLGTGATLHIPPGPSGSESPLTVRFSPVNSRRILIPRFPTIRLGCCLIC